MMKKSWVTPELIALKISATYSTVIPTDCPDGIYVNDAPVTEFVCS